MISVVRHYLCIKREQQWAILEYSRSHSGVQTHQYTCYARATYARILTPTSTHTRKYMHTHMLTGPVVSFTKCHGSHLETFSSATQ